MTASQSSSAVSAAGARRIVPALFTRMSRPPRPASVSRTSRSGASVSAMSPGQGERAPAERPDARGRLFGSPRARVDGHVGPGLGQSCRDRRPEPARGARDERDAAGERERPAHRAALPGSRPEPLAAYSGCTLTTPNWRSSPSRCAAIIQRKLIEPPGAPTPGW